MVGSSVVGPERSSDYDEVYLALGKFKLLLRLLGVFPIDEEEEGGGGGGRPSTLTIRWTLVGLLPLACSALGIFLYFYLVMFQYIVLIPNPVEAAIRGATVVPMAFFAAVNLSSLAAAAPLWPSYFYRFRSIDRALDLRLDAGLRRHAGAATLVAVLLFATLIGASLLTAVSRLLYEDFSGAGFPLGVFFYATSINGCHILPEILFTYLCRAIGVRLRLITDEVSRLRASAAAAAPSRRLEASDRLERCRFAFRALMESVEGTNRILGAVLLTTCAINPLALSVVVYFIVRESMQNAGINGLKFILFFSAFSRIASVCYFADFVLEQITTLKKNLFQIPSCALSEESVHEVAGTVLTYALTLLQFDREIIMQSMEAGCSGTKPETTELRSDVG